VYWLKWPGLATATQVFCNQTADFGTGVKGGWMAYCHPTNNNIASSKCGNGIPYASLKGVQWTEHVWQSLPDGWWMHVGSNLPISSNGTSCTATITVKSDIGGWGKTKSPQLNSLSGSSNCGGGGCWWGNQSNCDSGAIHLRGTSSQTGGSGDTMTNGWNQITHGGGLGGGNGGKHTSFGAGGTANSASNWAGFLR
jgi:hypothetical protein